ncbi:3-oxoadipate enol-lactonase [Corynebacterium sp. S7]
MTILHYVERGDANNPTVVFLGSIASTTEMWAPQLDALEGTHHLLALDHRGHGNSPVADVAPGETSVADLAQDVLDTLDEAGVDSFKVVGLSMGGAIAQYLAATSDRVEKVALCCTATKFGGPEKWQGRAKLTRAEGMEPMADGVLDLWFTDDFKENNPAEVAKYLEMIKSTSGEGYAQGADALAYWDFADRLGEITVLVLTIAGDQDKSTPPSALEEIASGVSGEVTSVVVSPGAHVPTVESPEQFTKALVDFL